MDRRRAARTEVAVRICIVNPYHSGSHAQWADGLAKHLGLSDEVQNVELLSTPGRHWKWRMHGAAVALASKFQAKFEGGSVPDVLICTDMMDVGLFRSLLPVEARGVPIALYFHENQLTFPDGLSEPPPDWDRHYAFMNVASALVADALWFNSDHHRRAFLQAVPGFMAPMPDLRLERECAELAGKSLVLPLGVDGAAMDAARCSRLAGPPIVVWNHRWERDKCPEHFFEALEALRSEGMEFRLTVLGQSFTRSPKIFSAAKASFKGQIHHWGFAPTRAEYYERLWEAHILFVTSRHDFFGLSLVEGAWCGLQVVAPNALAYPEHFDAIAPESASRHGVHLVARDELTDMLRRAIQSAAAEGDAPQVAGRVEKYDWPIVALRYLEAAHALNRPRPLK